MTPEIMSIRSAVWFIALLLVCYYIFTTKSSKDDCRENAFKIAILLLALATSAKYLLG